MVPKSLSRCVLAISAAAVLMGGMSGCAMTRGQQHAAIGSAAGGALGYVLTGGPVGTIVGAAAGGAIGAASR